MTRNYAIQLKLLTFSAAMILAAISMAPSPASGASLKPLGDLPGGEFSSRASAVSADGSVVVGSSPSASASAFSAEAFRWTSGGGMVGLGDLPGGFFESSAIGVSADGSVVVGRSSSQAFRWTSDGGMVGLGDLPGGANSGAIGVSGNGSVVVGWSLSTDFEAFRWTSEGGMVGLGDLPGGSFHSGANGVSGDGSVIVGNSYSASGQEAFRWTSGGMVGLGDLPGGGFDSWAFGVSADGSVVVGYGTSASGREGFRWTSGGMVGLGDLPGGGFDSSAYGVSGDGSVVVGYGTSASGTEALLWTTDGGMKRLWDVLLADGVDPAADGWADFEVASGISADGNTIVGWGTRNGNTEAFVAFVPTNVPEPAAGALALLGVSSILLLRRRSLRRPDKFRCAPGGIRARRQIMRSRRSALLAILLCTSPAARAFGAASLTPLGILPGGSGSVAKAVSADGSVVVGHSTFAHGLNGVEAFRWTSGGGMVGLGDLPGGSFYSAARGVSGDGSVIVGYSDSGSTSVQAFRWTSAGGMVGLGNLLGGSYYSDAVGVSGDGSVIVGVSTSPSGGEEAFRWTSGGGMVGLGDLLPPGVGGVSRASGVSADGSVIVGTSIAGGFGCCEAFRWTSGGGMVGLGGLPGGTFTFASGAVDVSGDGSVVVGWNYADGESLSGYEAFRWTSDGGMVGLGPLPGGAYSAPYGVSVSADGSVIVGFGTSDSGQEAYRWTSDGGMERLWDVLLAEGIDPAADGWTDLAAHGISADGNTIVGSGQRNGTIEAFVAVIPISSPLPGDFNGDNVVDAADYIVWRKNNINGESGYNTWRANFGRTAGSGAAGYPLGASAEPLSAAVPEPTAQLLLLLSAAAPLLGYRTSRKKRGQISYLTNVY